MFSFTGLNPKQTKSLVEDYHVYLTCTFQLSSPVALSISLLTVFVSCIAPFHLLLALPSHLALPQSAVAPPYPSPTFPSFPADSPIFSLLLANGRISMAGLNKSNVKRFAKAVDAVVRAEDKSKL
jgi:hypothetical protein